MRALITGISGFVGKHLSKFLLEKGFNVFGTDLVKSDGLEGVNFIEADIADGDSVNKLVSEAKPDYIFHLAALSSVQVCRDKPELARKVNVGGTENIIKACAKAGIKPRVVITSTAYVYGIPEKVPIDENHPVNPVNEYGKLKVEQEDAALKLCGEHKIDVMISRSFNHIGPGQGLGFVCSDFAKQVAEIEKGTAKPEIIVGDLSAKRDFTDVRDMVRAYLLLAEKGKAGEIYNIGSGNEYSMKKILDILISKAGIKADVVEDLEKFGKSKVPVFSADNRKFVELTGWKPEFSMEQTLSDILDYWRKKVS